MATEHLLKTPTKDIVDMRDARVSEFTLTLASIMTKEDQDVYKKGLREGSEKKIKLGDDPFKDNYVSVWDSKMPEEELNLQELAREFKLESEDSELKEKASHAHVSSETIAFWEEKFGRIPKVIQPRTIGTFDEKVKEIKSRELGSTIANAETRDELERLAKLAGIPWPPSTTLISPGVTVTVRDDSGWEDKNLAPVSLTRVKGAPSHQLGLYVDEGDYEAD